MRKGLFVVIFIAALLAILASQDSSLRAATFNIQDFGQTKMSKPDVVRIIASIVRQYDVVAIQEISDKDGTVIPALIGSVNSLGPPFYNYSIGPRLGSSPEQYAYIYREGLVLTKNFTAEGSFERPPYIACFAGERDFCLATIHTPPKDALKEIKLLDGVAATLSTLDGDWLILGDFNADCDYASEAELPDFNWVVPSSADTTVGQSDCAYDRIVSSPQITPSDWGVYRFDSAFGLDSAAAKAVSDHYPIWADFQPKE